MVDAGRCWRWTPCMCAPWTDSIFPCSLQWLGTVRQVALVQLPSPFPPVAGRYPGLRLMGKQSGINLPYSVCKVRLREAKLMCGPSIQTGANWCEHFSQNRVWWNYYEYLYLCAKFLIGTDVVVYCSILLTQMSEVNRAEAETCFLNMLNIMTTKTFFMLLLFLMITSQAVQTKVQNTTNTT